jgi:hypothetical protein
MNLSELQALEKIQIGDIKSAIDQIKYLIIQNNQTQANLNKIFQELDTKVNLQSEYLTALDPILKIGSGTVSANGINVTGIGTLFTREISVGNSIKIGTETQVVATIVDDLNLTVVSAFTSTSVNQVYGVLKLLSKEVLTGNFEFGVTNGTPFAGVVNQGSVFQYYGRMTDPYDIINVQFAQRLFTPAMIRAANSILRTGDTVGDASLVYEYLFKNVNWTFDTSSSVYYDGPITQPNHLATLKTVQDYVTTATTKRYIKSIDNTLTELVANKLEFYGPDFFQITGPTEFTIHAPVGEYQLLIVVSATAETTHGAHDDHVGVELSVSKNGQQIGYSYERMETTVHDRDMELYGNMTATVTTTTTVINGDTISFNRINTWGTFQHYNLMITTL